MNESTTPQPGHRALLGFAIGNLVPALVLGIGTYALPLRFWGLDVPIVLLVLWLLGTSGVAVFRRQLAHLALWLGSVGLLIAGILLFTLFALSFAFLSGIHGSFGELGELLMALVLALVFPYTLVYPALELLWLRRRFGQVSFPKIANRPASVSAEPAAAAQEFEARE